MLMPTVLISSCAPAASLFDSGYTWVISVPLALLMVRAIHADVIVCYAVVEGANLIKCILGYCFIRSGSWIQNLTRLTD